MPSYAFVKRNSSVGVGFRCAFAFPLFPGVFVSNVSLHFPRSPVSKREILSASLVVHRRQLMTRSFDRLQSNSRLFTTSKPQYVSVLLLPLLLPCIAVQHPQYPGGGTSQTFIAPCSSFGIVSRQIIVPAANLDCNPLLICAVRTTSWPSCSNQNLSKRPRVVKYFPAYPSAIFLVGPRQTVRLVVFCRSHPPRVRGKTRFHFP